MEELVAKALIWVVQNSPALGLIVLLLQARSEWRTENKARDERCQRQECETAKISKRLDKMRRIHSRRHKGHSEYLFDDNATDLPDEIEDDQ